MSSPDPDGVVYLSESAYDHLLPYGNRRTARNDILHPRSNHVQSQFVDRYTDDFQMPLHFDQYNPKTWPDAYVKHQLERGVHPYSQQPPNPTQIHGDAHAPGWAHHSGREVIIPVSGRGNESLTPASHCSPVSQPSAKAEQPKGSRTARKDEVGKGTDAMSLSVLGYDIVPQSIFVGPAGGSILPSIEFIPTSSRSYYKLGIDVDRACATHGIENPEDQVFSQVPGIDTISIMIQWPGYLRYPYERTIPNVRNLRRGELFNLVCGVVIAFVQALKARRCYVDREFSQWMIGYRGLRIHKFFVAGLHHRGGNYFQPEIRVPCPRGQ